LNDGVMLVPVVEGASEAWILTLPAPSPVVAVEYTLAIFVVVGRTLSGGNENPDQIELESAPPADAADQHEYERVFGCPVRWNAGRNALDISTQRLDRKLAHITPSLARAVEEHAEKLLAELPNASAQAARVREHIVDALRAGPVTPDEVCRRLKMSKRTLRRRLQEEGRTFSDLLSEVRRDLAHRYLEDPNRSITEVAFLLGFADTSAFQRAFRRWYGLSASEYRKGMRSARN
jgi:AraC-like DNA-binding protein